ncbi:MAG: nucleotide exchange factor GrpE [Acidobacteria bacterium]|nr:MAG: nucleotide exchange factor GrpE [Acidobacteriota bacterium]
MFRKRRRHAQAESAAAAGEQSTEEEHEEQLGADMAERNATQEAREQDTGGEHVRVVDRRRVRTDETGAGVTVQEGAAEAPSLKPKYVEELEARTRAAEQKALDVQARFEQVRAQLQRETDETRQRLNRAADERAARAKAEFVSSLLPVLDNLQRAVASAEQGGTLEALLDGLHGTISGFEQALNNAGAEPINSVGAQFDPELHEAVDTIEVAPERDHTVTAEYSRGYKMGGQLLRPARVQVGRARSNVQAHSEE